MIEHAVIQICDDNYISVDDSMILNLYQNLYRQCSKWTKRIRGIAVTT